MLGKPINGAEICILMKIINNAAMAYSVDVGFWEAGPLRQGMLGAGTQRGLLQRDITILWSQDVPLGGLECVACESHIISNQEQLPLQEIHAHVCKHVSGLIHSPMWQPEVTLRW